MLDVIVAIEVSSQERDLLGDQTVHVVETHRAGWSTDPRMK